MSRRNFLKSFLFIFFALAVAASCKDRVHIGEKEIVKNVNYINDLASDIIKLTIRELLDKDDKTQTHDLRNISILNAIYDHNSYQPLWTNNGKWLYFSDTLLSFIKGAKYYGLFPQDYSENKISGLHYKLVTDTSSKENKMDASLWAEADLLLTSAFVRIVKDLKAGRIIPDSIIMKTDTSLNSNFFIRQLLSFQRDGNIELVIAGVEPKHSGYHNLKKALPDFVKNADFKPHTFIKRKDSAHLMETLYKRLNEEDSIELSSSDSGSIADGIRQYQRMKGLKENGKVSSELISMLNRSDMEKFIRIAITMDRYKQLISPMPRQYIWVNIPGYYMQIRENDSVRLVSKVVVGKPETRTPVLTSTITNMVTYPQWTIPESIVKKDVLPGLKKDPSYSIKKGFSIIDRDGNEINPFLVDWSKFKINIPYKVIQGSGDDNALGVIKFNFNNRYSVYLHDTNQRYLFARNSRALSHGCVRVEEWKSLAYYILRNDKAFVKNATPVDSVVKWLRQKQKKVIPIHKRIPLFIRYFTCDVRNGKIVFYDDIYGEDRRLKEKFFAHIN